MPDWRSLLEIKVHAPLIHVYNAVHFLEMKSRLQSHLVDTLSVPTDVPRLMASSHHCHPVNKTYSKQEHFNMCNHLTELYF